MTASKVARGLVRQDDLGIVDQGSGYAYSLLLAAGKLRWNVMGALLQSHAFKRVERFLLVRHAVEILRQHNVFQRREIGNQVELLEHKADFLRPHPIQLTCGNIGDVFTIKPNLARSRTIKAANQVHQRRLARAGRAHDRDPLAGIDVEGETIERADDTAVGLGLRGVQTADILELDHLTPLSRS